MRLAIKNRLLFAAAKVEYKGASLLLEDMLVDTGSGGTVLAADRVAAIGVVPAPEDTLRRITGVGGAEFVFEKEIDRLSVGDLVVERFKVEIGALDYGFAIKGILGLDFFRATRAVIDLGGLELGRNRD